MLRRIDLAAALLLVTACTPDPAEECLDDMRDTLERVRQEDHDSVVLCDAFLIDDPNWTIECGLRRTWSQMLACSVDPVPAECTDGAVRVDTLIAFDITMQLMQACLEARE